MEKKYRLIPIPNPSAPQQDGPNLLISLARLELSVTRHVANDAVSSARSGLYWNSSPERPFAKTVKAFNREAGHVDDDLPGSDIPSSATAHILNFLNLFNQRFAANNNQSADARDAIHCPLGCRHSHENKVYQG